MSLFRRIKNLFLLLEDSLSKEHSCICCNSEMLDGSEFQVCEKCLNNMQKIKEPVCSKCGEALEDGNLNCSFCEKFNYAFKSNRSIFYYDENSSKIIKGLKYNQRKYYAKHIAKLMCEDKLIFEKVDLITFVPISGKRKKKRGFNQAEEIAKEISKLVNIEVVELLLKVKDNKTQAGLSQKERLENLKDTFKIKESEKEKILGKRILIIDDVFTTGATLNECSIILKMAKPKAVKTLTFAKTKLFSIN